jgi:hypothetical protein
MATMIIGDPTLFAIEYELETLQPLSGRMRIWLEGRWFGDIRRSNFLYHVATSLQAMVVRDPNTVTALYTDADDVPGEDELFASGDSSWGDSFDDFHFVLYAVNSTMHIHFHWELPESRRGNFLHYPQGRHRVRVPYRIFDDVVTNFLSALALPQG